MAVDANGILLGVISAPANRHDSPLLAETLDSVEALGPLPKGVSVHLDCGYDSVLTRKQLEERADWRDLREGKPPPLQDTKWWVVERTNSWHSWQNARRKLVWFTEGGAGQ